MTENRIAELRAQVDTINLQILELLNKRASLASEIGKEQAQLGSSFYDPQREAFMLTQLELNNKGPFSNETIKALFREIFRASMALEEKEARTKILVQRKSADENTVITLPDGVTKIGGGNFTLLTGSCAVENYEQMDTVAANMAQYGIKLMRGMAYKPRTSPYDYQGMGEEGLKMARKVADKYGMFVVSEIMDKSQIDLFADYVDVFWVGARNMQNSFLLKALGKIKQPIVLKNGLASTLEEFLYGAEYIVSAGNPNVILMTRGIRTYEKWTRNTLDLGAIAVLKQESHLPVIVDISHSAGRRDIAIPMAKAAKAVGADGLMVEIHPNPPVAMSDAKQQLDMKQFAKLMEALDIAKVQA